MPKLASLKRETDTVTIETDDEPLVIVYRKGFLSPDLAAQIDAADSLPPVKQLGILADIVHGAVLSWNLTDDAGAPIATTREGIRAVDADVLAIIAGAIQEAMRPDPLSEGSSSNGSTPRGDLVAARTGTAS